MYLFFDEVQRVPGWEDAINSFRVDFNCDIYVTGQYIQVTESMTSAEVRERELAPLQKINDNYEKMVLSMNTGMDVTYDGIKSIYLIDWLLTE